MRNLFMNIETANDGDVEKLHQPPSPQPHIPTACALTQAASIPDLFPRCPGETPRAFGAFAAYLQLGPARSLQALADKLGESPGTVRNWSSKYDWANRVHAYHSGILQEQTRLETARHLQQHADWSRRLAECREQEWQTAQKLIAAARCFLESFGEQQLERMTLSQASGALRIASTIARAAVLGAELPVDGTTLSPLQQQLLASVARLYGQPAQAGGPDASAPSSTGTAHP